MTTLFLAPAYRDELGILDDELLARPFDTTEKALGVELDQQTYDNWVAQVVEVGWDGAPGTWEWLQRQTGDSISHRFSRNIAVPNPGISMHAPALAVRTSILAEAIRELLWVAEDTSMLGEVSGVLNPFSDKRDLTQATLNTEQYRMTLARDLVAFGMAPEAAAIVVESQAHLSTTMAARVLGVTEQTLFNWRKKGTGPRTLKFPGGRGVILYPIGELSSYLYQIAAASR